MGVQVSSPRQFYDPMRGGMPDPSMGGYPGHAMHVNAQGVPLNYMEPPPMYFNQGPQFPYSGQPSGYPGPPPGYPGPVHGFPGPPPPGYGADPTPPGYPPMGYPGDPASSGFFGLPGGVANCAKWLLVLLVTALLAALALKVLASWPMPIVQPPAVVQPTPAPVMPPPPPFPGQPGPPLMTPAPFVTPAPFATPPPAVTAAPTGPTVAPFAGPPSARCLGGVNIAGHGPVQIINAGANTPMDASGNVQVNPGQSVTPLKSGRAYFADTCSGPAYNPNEYLALNLHGGSLSYTVDLSGADCGCIAALYLVNMHENTDPGTCGGDYYCDANHVCGVNCEEVDIQEANKHMWKTTDHGAHDGEGKRGHAISDAHPRYGPGGSCINTENPFQVKASFPPDASSIQVELSQDGCTRTTHVEYPELAGALAHMTPVISYWYSANAADISWFDGKVCKEYDPEKCGAAVTFSSFSFSPR